MKKIESHIKDSFLIEIDMKNQYDNLSKKLEIKKKEKASLFNTLFKTRKGLIWSLSSVMAMGIMITVSAVLINQYLNTPTYQGMEVLDNALLSQNFLLSNVSDEFVDDIENQIGVETIDGISYYTETSERIIITVLIDNPEFFEILSFTLNGRLYQTFEFIEGSNSEQLLIYFDVQSNPGIQEITIDAIKYVDGTQIRNARFEADRTIQIGILYEGVPNVTNVSEIVQATAFGVSFVVNDTNLLLNPLNGTLIYVFDGTSIIFTNEVSIGTNVMPYSNLRMGQTYEYAIVGVFDPLDGLGKRAFILQQNTFTTSKGFEFDETSSTVDSISLSLDKLDLNNGIVTQVEVLLNDNVILTSNENNLAYTFNDLLSNTLYDVVVNYSYSINENGENVTITDTIETQIQTDARPIPTLTFEIISVDDSQVEFTYLVSDIEIVALEKAELYLGNTLIETITSLEDFNLSSLLSDTNYAVVLYYAYDLNDGNGPIPTTYSSSFKTESKFIPSVMFTSAINFGNQLFAKFRITDQSDVASILSFDLYKDGQIVQTINSFTTRLVANQTYIFEGDLTFTYLGSGDYLLVANYSYDLNDGQGIINVDSIEIEDENTLRFISN